MRSNRRRFAWLSLLVAALAALATSSSRAGDSKVEGTASGPRIAFDGGTEYLFPTAYVGSHVTHAFRFHNRGSSDLVIRKVDTSCGCTVSRISRAQVPPGESGTIELTLDTSEKIGKAIMVRGTVFSNDASQTAAGPCTTLLELKGEVVSCYKLMPTGAYMGQVIRANGPKVMELRAIGVLEAKEGFKILSIETPAAWLKVEPRALGVAELSSDSKCGYAIQVTVLPSVPVGDFLARVVVTTDCSRQPTIRFPVIGVAHGVVKAPENLLMGHFRRGDDVERLAPLERTDGTASGIPILGLEYDETRFEVVAEVAIEGVRTDLKIKVKKTIPPGPFSAPILVRLNDARTPLLRINVFGDVAPRVAPDPLVGLCRPGAPPLRISVPVEGGKVTEISVEPADAPFEAELQPADQTGAPFVLVKIKGEPAAGTRGALVLATDVAGEEKVRVPLVVQAP